MSDRQSESGAPSDELPAFVELPTPWSQAPVAVVVPTYNEAENLPKLAKRIFGLGLTNIRLIVVDDNSPDGTGRIADELAGEYNSARADSMVVIHRQAKGGIGRAYLVGMKEAIARDDQFVVQMDADLSHQPEAIPGMLGTLLSTDAGLVIGSRYIASGSLTENWGLYRRLLSRGGSIYVNAVTHMRIADTTGGFKVWRADTLKSIDLAHVRSMGFSFQIEMNYRALEAGVKVVEVPIHFSDRYSGSSKITLGIQVEGLWVPFALRFAAKSPRRRRAIG
jgi:dolichol-phosphate mannosyltransferase